MNKNLFLTSVFLILTSFIFNTVQAQTDFSDKIAANSNPPAGYDANLKTGDLTVAANGGSRLQEVEIILKRNGIYRAALLDSDDQNIVYHRDNPVYSYFDHRKFKALVDNYRHHLQTYVEY